MRDYDKNLVERLNTLIEFPTNYTFKVIGINSNNFKEDVFKIIREVLDDLRDISIREIISRKKKYSSLSIKVKVDDVYQLLDIYTLLKQQDYIKFIL